MNNNKSNEITGGAITFRSQDLIGVSTNFSIPGIQQHQFNILITEDSGIKKNLRNLIQICLGGIVVFALKVCQFLYDYISSDERVTVKITFELWETWFIVAYLLLLGIYSLLKQFHKTERDQLIDKFNRFYQENN